MLMPCSICRDLLLPSAIATVTECGHLYHKTCLVQWFERSKTCPECRQPASELTLRRVFLPGADRHLDDGDESDPATLRCKLVEAEVAQREMSMLRGEAEEGTKALADVRCDAKRKSAGRVSCKKRPVTSSSSDESEEEGVPWSRGTGSARGKHSKKEGAKDTGYRLRTLKSETRTAESISPRTPRKSAPKGMVVSSSVPDDRDLTDTATSESAKKARTSVRGTRMTEDVTSECQPTTPKSSRKLPSTSSVMTPVRKLEFEVNSPTPKNSRPKLVATLQRATEDEDASPTESSDSEWQESDSDSVSDSDSDLPWASDLRFRPSRSRNFAKSTASWEKCRGNFVAGSPKTPSSSAKQGVTPTGRGHIPRSSPKTSAREDCVSPRTPAKTKKSATPGVAARLTPLATPDTPLSCARSVLRVSAVPRSLPRREKEFENIRPFLQGKLQDRMGGHDRWDNRKDDLRRNVRLLHRRYLCERCGKRFYRLAHLTNHLVVHTGLKPFSCHQCDQKFNRNDSLRRHLRLLHT